MKTPLIAILVGAMFWNVENFLSLDAGKCAMIGKTILWAGAPEVVGLAEVGNASIVRSICRNEILRKLGYRFVHYDSPDKRGIDVALLYRADSLKLVRSYPIPIAGGRTRDILYVCFRDSKGELWHFYVNHHPSKYGGASSSIGRERAMNTLVSSVDSLLHQGERHIVAMGDFNDTPNGTAFGIMEGKLKNLGSLLLATKKSDNIPTGSIRYHGKWELIDNFLVSEDVCSFMTMKILFPQFILEKDKSFPGIKPKRTRVGPRYNGGVSDHLPVLLK